MRKLKLLLPLVLSPMIYGCAHTIEVQNEKFRIENSSQALLGSIGYVSGTGIFGGKNGYVRVEMPMYKNLKLTESIVDFSEIKDSEASFSEEIQGKLNKDISFDQDGSDSSKVKDKMDVKYHILSFESPYQTLVQINAEDGNQLQKILKNYGKDSRIISKILVAYDHQRSKALQAAGSISLSAKLSDEALPEGGLTGKIDGAIKLDNNKSIKLSDGYIVGYSYDIICWGKKENGDVEIVSSYLEKYGASVKCKSGSQDPAEAK